MEYPKDLSFTAEEMSALTVKESEIYKSLKKMIWEANQEGFYELNPCLGFYDATAKATLRQLRIEGFDIYKEYYDNDTFEVWIKW